MYPGLVVSGFNTAFPWVWRRRRPLWTKQNARISRPKQKSPPMMPPTMAPILTPAAGDWGTGGAVTNTVVVGLEPNSVSNDVLDGDVGWVESSVSIGIDGADGVVVRVAVTRDVVVVGRKVAVTPPSVAAPSLGPGPLPAGLLDVGLLGVGLLGAGLFGAGLLGAGLLGGGLFGVDGGVGLPVGLAGNPPLGGRSPPHPPGLPPRPPPPPPLPPPLPPPEGGLFLLGVP